MPSKVDALLDAARGAYVQGMQVSASLSAAIMLGTAVLAFILLRRPTGKP